MKVLIKFKKYIIENGKKEKETDFEISGIYQEHTLKYIDNDKVMNLVTIKNDEVIVERKSDITSVMSFKNKTKSNFLMKAPFGKLELDIYTNELCINKESIYILYKVLEDFNSYKTYELYITFTAIK